VQQQGDVVVGSVGQQLVDSSADSASVARCRTATRVVIARSRPLLGTPAPFPVAVG